MKKVLLIGGFLLIAVIIAAGGVYGISRLSTGTVSAQESKPEKVMIIAVEEVVNGERFGGEVRITFEDPPELPDRGADAAGLFFARPRPRCGRSVLKPGWRRINPWYRRHRGKCVGRDC